MARTKSPSAILLEQFKGQAYHSIYENGCTLVQFTGLMDRLFKEVRFATGIELQVSYNQWQTRKRAWDDEWKINEGGPSSEARRELSKLPIWFDSKNDVIMQSSLKIDTPSLSEQVPKPSAASVCTAPPLGPPDLRGISRVWESQVPIRAFSSDTTDFDYTDATSIDPFTYTAAPDPTYSSYNDHYSDEYLHARFREGVLPSEKYLGQHDPPGGQKHNYAFVEESNTSRKYPLAHHNSVFNETVSDFDLHNYPSFAATVHDSHSFRNAVEKGEKTPRHNAHEPWHSSPWNNPIGQRQNTSRTFQGTGTHQYGGGF